MATNITYTSVPDFQTALRRRETLIVVLSGSWCHFCKEQAADMAAADPPLPFRAVFIDVRDWNDAFGPTYKVDVAPVTFVATPEDGAFKVGEGKTSVGELRRACEPYVAP